ncbi:NAD(P)-dependent dehydrogenase (short-subunit alcohol dehydrogenase family) [Stella humosa]|uniref:NAD(P)-dependent dehydrogenase (Short-subunit alcohol dehydrogenase family) n=1 Tax=Stella humosa TaxID=94 RepID=A0A3N1LLG5_9PROT|nr:SDR family oxidoreductase [Stella humosa]ROP91266.1 NAD(P)-dependent dehydrogenase (short-subunit alcohol dehydrogenase family) [Stella humosa]BBK34380.1 dehydrogenase [Stella humosa]
MRLANKVAIVTGAAQGIGLAIARRFVDEGARVMLADIGAERGAAAAAGLGANAAFLVCDVGCGQSAADLVAGTVARFGRVDVLVNNAGILHAAEFLDLEEADFDRVLRVNLKGTFLVGQAAARQMARQFAADGGRGSIVNLSSVTAKLAIPTAIPYVVSKAGVSQLTTAMAIALADKGVRVNAIGPGSIRTEMLQVMMNDETARRRILSRTPLGRCGEPEEIAAVALFLASEDSSYVTGQTIFADGGRMGLNYTVPVPE